MGLEPRYLKQLGEYGFRIEEVPPEVKAQSIPLDKLEDKIRTMISEKDSQKT